MNIFLSALNKIRFTSQTSIDKKHVFSVGSHKYAEKGYALLKNGEKIADHLMWISSNLLSTSDDSQSDYILAKPFSNQYLIFDKTGRCLTPNGLKIFNRQSEVPDDYPLFYGLDDEYGEILVKSNFMADKFLIYPHTKSMSKTFIEISPYNNNAQRKVRQPDLFYHYIDRRGKQISYPFISESESDDINGNRIQIVINSKGLETQVLTNQKHEWITKQFYDRIMPVKDFYIGLQNKGKILSKLDKDGQVVTQTSFAELKSIVNNQKYENINDPFLSQSQNIVDTEEKI